MSELDPQIIEQSLENMRFLAIQDEKRQAEHDKKIAYIDLAPIVEELPYTLEETSLTSSGSARIDSLPRLYADVWYSGPIYDRILFFNNDGQCVGGKKILSTQFMKGNPPSTEMSKDERWGFVSREGTIEVVDLHRKENLKIQRDERTELSIYRDERGRATRIGLSIESFDFDQYPHRTPPSYIATWEAHDKEINSLLIVSETDKVIELASFAIDNTVNKWALNKKDLDKQINPA